MNSIKKLFRPLFAAFASLLLILAPASFAAVGSNTVTIPLSLSIPESISLTPSSTSINLTNSTPSQTITLTAAWQIASGHAANSAQIYSWFSALPACGATCAPGGLTQYQGGFFTSSYNNGPSVTCNQGPFAGQTFGHTNQNCGSFTLSQNPASDFFDSVAVPFTLTAAFTSQQTTGTYTGGVLTIVFVIA